MTKETILFPSGIIVGPKEPYDYSKQNRKKYAWVWSMLEQIKYRAFNKVMEIHEDNDGYDVFRDYDCCPMCNSTFERDDDGNITDTYGGGPW